MKRTGIWLVAIAGAVVGVAAGQLTEGRLKTGGEDLKFPWLVQLNVMSDTLWGGSPRPDQFVIAVGDWVELSASLRSPPSNPDQPYTLEAEIKGEAVEQLAAVRPAALQTVGTRTAPLEVYLRPVPRRPSGSERRVFLRGKKFGKATIRTTVTRSGPWKEIREFEVLVTEQREEPLGGGLQ
jgi:hypothetical protein